jgi:hypothetical protein
MDDVRSQLELSAEPDPLLGILHRPLKREPADDTPQKTGIRFTGEGLPQPAEMLTTIPDTS